VIGSSAGGSEAVEEILSTLPVDADLRLLVVQHMLESFTQRFADRLDDVSEYDVRECDYKDSVRVGEALVARGGFNVIAVDDTNGSIQVKLTKKGNDSSLRPSADVTMSSIAETVNGNIVGIVLSGMGEDGAKGIQDIKQAGGMTLAQDEETSQIFGMPKRAIETGMVDKVLPQERIAQAVVEDS
jgi:two-component system chemotaxis response regulator CheB